MQWLPHSGKFVNKVGWAHGQNERREINEKIRDKETGGLQKTRKTTAKMEELCEERSRKGRGGRKSGEKR